MKFLKNKIKNYIFINIIKGYKILKKQNNLELFSLLNDELTKTKLNINKGIFFFFGNELPLIEVSIRQKLLREVGFFRLNKLILFSLSLGIPLCYPLTSEWIKVIEKYNLKVNKLISMILWKIFLIYKVFQSIKLIFNLFIYNFFSIYKKYNYYYFFNLSTKNIPTENIKYKNYGIFDTVLNNENEKILNCNHDIKNFNYSEKKISIQFQKYFYKPNKNLIVNLRILFWYLPCLVISLLGVIFSWKYPYFFYDCLLSKIVSEYDQKYLPNKVFYNQSSYIYRPYWTYFSDKKNISTIFYFYSTNIIEMYSKYQKIPDILGWPNITWNNYYFWNNFQKEYVERFVKKFNYKIIGPINFYPTPETEAPKIPKNSIIIFDVRPARIRLYSFLGKPYEFYRAKYMIKFVNDIYEITNKYNLNLVIKQKRKIADGTKFEDPEYVSFIKSLSAKDNVSIFDGIEGDSLNEIIKQSKLSISAPFTSTAILAKINKVNSIYYDPTGELEVNDLKSHKIITIQNKDKLLQYIKKIF